MQITYRLRDKPYEKGVFITTDEQAEIYLSDHGRAAGEYYELALSQYLRSRRDGSSVQESLADANLALARVLHPRTLAILARLKARREAKGE